MKKIILLFLTTCTFLNAQTITYFDIDWEETTQDSASYYRHIYDPVEPDTLFHIQDFYIDGTLQMDGYVTNIEYEDNFIGKVKWYYPNGVLKMFKTYGKSLKQFGPTETYLPNGQLRTKGTFEYGTSLDGIVPNSTYAAPYTKMAHGKLISRLNYYENTLQIAFEDFYRDDEYRLKKTVYYDKDGHILGTLNYVDNSYNTIDFGTKVEFYISYDGVVAKKTISHFHNKEAIKEQISYDKAGNIIAKGINKDDHHFDGIFIDNYTQSIVKSGVLKKQIYFNENWDTISTMIYKNGERWNGIIEGINATDKYLNGQLTRTRYYSPNKKTIRYKKIFGEPIDSIYWFDKNEKLLGIGIENDNEPWDGLHIARSINSTTYTNYKNGKKEGIQQLFDDDGTTLLSEKTYQNDEVIHDKTRNPLTQKMVECNYPNGKANGVFWEYNDESTYKNGFLIKKREFIEKDGSLNLKKETHFEANENHHKIKEIKFHNGNKYTLFYKNNRKDHGVDIDNNALYTFKNGDKNGYYEFFNNGKATEKGTYRNGQKHGKIQFYSPKEGKNFSCIYENGYPMDGDNVKNHWNEYDRCHYKNGKRHGERFNYYHHTRITNYVNGILDGISIDSLDNGTIFQGLYKNGEPYNGTFYDPEFDLGESYINGKKDGLFKSHLGYFIVMYEKFDHGNLIWEQGNQPTGDAIYSEGFYKNGVPFKGTFIRKTDDGRYFITTYKNGKKQDDMQWVMPQ